MREVAAVADVSLSTVSRVVNGVEVAPDLARRVRDAVALLGYRRDLTASTLRRADRLSATIGLLIEDVANPFFSALQRSVEDVAVSRNVVTFAGSSDEDAERERELVHAFASRRVDGLVIVPAGPDHSYLLRDRDAGVAMVFVDRPPAFIDIGTAQLSAITPTAATATTTGPTGHRSVSRLAAPMPARTDRKSATIIR